HGDEYDYSLVKYINHHTKVEIICKRHGSFWQSPNNHIRGQCCPKCNISVGERKIKDWLDARNIIYSREYIHKPFDKRLRFDFYLPDYQTFIEFDGRQHFEP